MSQIGHNIKKLRKVKGFSQQAFAELFELSRGNISSYEELRAEPKTDVVTKIANYFSIPLDHLFNNQLSVNEILNFNDHFETKEQEVVSDFKTIPFIDRNHISQILDFHDGLESLAKIQFPIYSPKDFLALELDESVNHHSDFQFRETNIAFFKKLEVDLLHTLDNQYGLFFSKASFFIGQFRVKEKQIFLVLNDWHEEEFSIDEIDNFWKYYGKFEKFV